MSDFWRSFMEPGGVEPVLKDPFAPSQQGSLFASREPEYKRSFLERVFAPFEAPQQALFKLTVSQNDGFQLRDLSDSFLHGARYFNPFSNQEPVLPHEVRAALGGGDIGNPWGAAGADLALSLLYDPLLVTGALKGAKLLTAGTRAERLVSMATNPAEAAIALGVQATRMTAEPGRRLLTAIAGSEARAQRWSSAFAQNFLNKYAGVSDEARLVNERMENNLRKWHQRQYHILREARRLGGGDELASLMGKTLESEAAYFARFGGELDSKHLKELDRIGRSIQRLGVDEDAFWRSYQDLRQLDMDIGEQALKLGLMDGATFQDMKATHLRRMYAAIEHPEDYIERIDAAILAKPHLAEDTTTFLQSKLTRELSSFRSTLDDYLAGRFTADANNVTDMGLRRNLAESINRADNAYFPQAADGRRRFNPKAFAEDFTAYAASAEGSAKSLPELLDYVKDEMLAGIKLPPIFYQTLANHLTASRGVVPGLRTFRDRLAQMASGPALTWRTFRDRAEVLAQRHNLSDEVRELLGEIESGFVRVTAEATDAAKAVEMRRFHDAFAGVHRVDDDEVLAAIEAAEEAFKRGDSAGVDTIVGSIRERYGFEDLSFEDVRGKRLGDVLKQVDNNITSAERNVAKNHILQIPDEDTFGSMRGRWTTPGNFHMVTRMQGANTVAHPVRRAWNTFGDMLKGGTGIYKLSKVILDPVAQFRNFVGNMFLMDLAGLNPLNLDNLMVAGSELVRYARTGKMGKYMQAAEDAGLNLFQHNYTRAELMRISEQIGELAAGKGLAKEWYGRMLKAVMGPIDVSTAVGVKMFEFNENLFKMMSFIEESKRLTRATVSARGLLDADTLRRISQQAGAKAEQALFDYSNVPYLVDFARQYGIIPFATFPFKVAPMLADTLYHRPWRLLKYDRIVEQANYAAAGGPENAAREINGLPSYMRDAMVVRLPFTRDNDGRPLYLDLSYFAPWYALTDMLPDGAEGDMRDASGFRGGVLSPPMAQLYNAFANNQDGFGNPIYAPSDTTATKFEKLGSYLVTFVAPASTPVIGARSQAVGRALMAYAQDTPEPVDWMERLGRQLAGRRADDPLTTSGGHKPQTQAQVGVNPESGLGTLLGTVLGLTTGGAVASDPSQQAFRTRMSMRANRTEIARQMARVRSSNMPYPEKLKEIARLRELLLESDAQSREELSGL